MKQSMIALAALCAAACAGASKPVAAPPAPVPAPVVTPVAPPPVMPPRVTPPPAPAPATAFNPEGKYDLQVSFGGQQMPLAVELWRENGKWFGTAGIQNLGSADLSALSQDGRKLRLTVVSQNGPSFVLNLEVKADNTVTGDWSGNNDGSRISGKKIS